MNFIGFFLAQESSERSIWWCFSQNDLIGWLVITILGAASVYVWQTIFSRRSYLRKADRANKAFEKKVHNVKLIEWRPSKGADFCVYQNLMVAAYKAFDEHGGTPETSEELELRLNYLQNAVQRFLANVEDKYTEKLPTIGSAVTLGPFLGLLGTVYGITITFATLSEKATIAQLAPGVSAALTATMCGLILAIPSVFFYNILLAKTKKMYTELENFASIFVDNFAADLRNRLSLKNKTLRQSGTLEMTND
ncbi:MAG: MotA/TolQ/ExbB proton channel family protein [Opitutales bacterium]|nr:MotA/TolQ/ExbB proton channel family protein [Opitutales bacterium]